MPPWTTTGPADIEIGKAGIERSGSLEIGVGQGGVKTASGNGGEGEIGIAEIGVGKVDSLQV